MSQWQDLLIQQHLHSEFLLRSLGIFTVVKHEYQVGGVGHDVAASELAMQLFLVIVSREGLLVFEVAHESEQWKKGLCMTKLKDDRRGNWLRPLFLFNCFVQVLEDILKQGAAGSTINSIPIASFPILLQVI